MLKAEQHSCFLLHAAGIQMATRCGHPNETGGEGQQQGVAGPVQCQGQQLTGLRRILATSGDAQKCEDRR